MRPLAPGDSPKGFGTAPPPWMADGGVTLPGRVLGAAGLQAPAFHPEQALLLHVERSVS